MTPTTDPGTIRNLLVTGGGGFVGGNFVRLVLDRRPGWSVTVFDSLKGCRNRPVLRGLAESHPGRFQTVLGAVNDAPALERLFSAGGFDTVVHFAAKNPSGQEVSAPLDFVRVNVLGTACLLEAARKAWKDRSGRFLHLSSYEVYGSHPSGLFTEETPLDPSTPYAASKAAADELTLAYHRTYGMGTMVSRTTNIYGPFQSRDKLIPAMALKASRGEELPIYGSGKIRRDWIHVDDHNAGVLAVIEQGSPGEVYHLGAGNEIENLDLLRSILLEVSRHSGISLEGLEKQVKFVEDRQAHDRRRALDATKAKEHLGFRAEIPFAEGLSQAVKHFLDQETGDHI